MWMSKYTSDEAAKYNLRRVIISKPRPINSVPGNAPYMAHSKKFT